jgi:hypothetical protein
MTDRGDAPIGRLPEHLLIEIFIRLPVSEWVQVGCVNKHCASIFQGECLWQTAISKNWPSAGLRKRWPGPIPRGSAKRWVLKSCVVLLSPSYIHMLPLKFSMYCQILVFVLLLYFLTFTSLTT